MEIQDSEGRAKCASAEKKTNFYFQLERDSIYAYVLLNLVLTALKLRFQRPLIFFPFWHLLIIWLPFPILLHCRNISVCNFQSMKSPVQLNSLFLIFFCYITWFDETRHWRPCKRGLHVKFYCFLAQRFKNYKLIWKRQVYFCEHTTFFPISFTST